LLGLSGYRLPNDSAFFARRCDQICILGVSRFDVEMQADDTTKNDRQPFHPRARSPLSFKPSSLTYVIDPKIGCQVAQQIIRSDSSFESHENNPPQSLSVVWKH